MPWWQRQLYLEEMRNEARDREAAARGDDPGAQSDPWGALMGDLEDAAAS